MKNLYPLFIAAGLLLALTGCKSKYDKEGRLILDYLTTNTSNKTFKPMMRADSASVADFVPDTFYFKGAPYTGSVAFYDSHGKIGFHGFLNNGVPDSAWKFYYASGGVRMEGVYEDGRDVGFWRSYYGYNKPKIDKYYDEQGYMLMRIEYYDNGKIKNYQNVKSPLFGDKERSYSFDRKGGTQSMYVEDSVLILKDGEQTERIGENIFVKKGSSTMDVVK